jgi:hypothetical protein
MSHGALLPPHQSVHNSSVLVQFNIVQHLCMSRLSVTSLTTAACTLQHVHWTRVFTDRINNSTKLVGPTISCEGGSQTSAAVRIHYTGNCSQWPIVHVARLFLWRAIIGPTRLSLDVQASSRWASRRSARTRMCNPSWSPPTRSVQRDAERPSGVRVQGTASAGRSSVCVHRPAPARVKHAACNGLRTLLGSTAPG